MAFDHFTDCQGAKAVEASEQNSAQDSYDI